MNYRGFSTQAKNFVKRRKATQLVLFFAALKLFGKHFEYVVCILAMLLKELKEFIRCFFLDLHIFRL
jgi:hypothetical protein